MPMPNERARTDWVDGRDVLLEDGQVWTFPLPRVEFRLTPDGPLEMKSGPVRETNRKFGARFWDLQGKLGEYIDRTNDVPDGEPDGFDIIAYYRLLKPVAADLLLRNYDLTPQMIDNMLTYVPGDPENLKMWTSINEVARGIGGRPDAVAEAG